MPNIKELAMNKQKLLVIMTALAVILVTAGVTFVTLSYVDNKNNVSDGNKKVSEKIEEPPRDGLAEVTDKAANMKASKIEEEAAKLIETNPGAALTKYSEAEEAYRSAGNVHKAGEMQANALTAELLIQQNSR